MKIKKAWLIILFFSLITFSLSVSAIADGWEMENYYLYYSKDGNRLTGLQTVDGHVYNFDIDGSLKGNGKVQETGYGIVYPDTNNKLLTGWRTVENKKYYFYPLNGRAAVPNMDMWMGNAKHPEIDGVNYLFSRDGSLIINSWWTNYGVVPPYFHSDDAGRVITGYKQIDGYYYYFNELGVSQSGFQIINGNIHYFSEGNRPHTEGYRETRGWEKIDQNWYYFDLDSGDLRTTPIVINGFTYVFDEEGRLKITEPTLIRMRDKLYGVDKDGNYLLRWQTIAGNTYYFEDYKYGDYGAAKKGVHILQAPNEESGYTYYFNEDFQLVKSAFVTLDSKLYYYDGDGKRLYGWLKNSGETYYFDAYQFSDTYGAALQGLHVLPSPDHDKDYYYYFDEKYHLLKSLFVIIDDKIYYFGSDGKGASKWTVIEGSTYYFDPHAYTGGPHWLEKDGKWNNYTFDKKGRLIKEGDTPVPIETVVSDATYKIVSNTAIYQRPQEKNIKSVTIPATIKYEGKTYKVTEIASSAFKGFKKLTKVNIGKNVKTIGKNAFYGCEKLKTVSGGTGVTTIGDGAFQKCCVLAKITIEKNVKKIGKNAFNACKKLKTITVKTTKLTSSSVGKDAFKGIQKKATFKCPKNKLDLYKKVFQSKGAPKTTKFK